MKIRRDFVSNSSSSSYVCDVCSEEVSGMDLSLREAEMVECVNDHTICESHTMESDEPDFTDQDLMEENPELFEKLRKMVLADSKYRFDDIDGKSLMECFSISPDAAKTIPYTKEEIERYKYYSDFDADRGNIYITTEQFHALSVKDFFKEFAEKIEEITSKLTEKKCPCCSFNNMVQREALRYLMKIHDVTEEAYLEEIKNRFGSYAEFQEYIREADEDETED